MSVGVWERRHPGVFSSLLDQLMSEAGVEEIVVSHDMHEVTDGLEIRTHLIDGPTELAETVNGLAEVPLVLPPWNPAGERDFWTSLGRLRSPMLALVPRSALQTRLPRRTSDVGEVKTVLVGAPKWGAVHAAFEAAVVEYRPLGTGPQVTKFFRIPADATEDEITADFLRLMHQGGGTTKYGFVHRGNLVPGESLLPEFHDPETKAQIDDLIGFGSEAVVGDVFEVLRSRPARDIRHSQPDAVQGRALRGRDITLTGEINPPDDDQFSLAVPPPTPGDVPLRQGDLLMRDILDANRAALGLPAVVLERHLPAAATSSLMVLRPRTPLTREELEFYRLYLGSQRCRRSLRSEGLRVSPFMARAPLPRPDGDLLGALEQIGRAQRVLRTWVDEGLGLSIQAFEGAARQTRQELIERGRLLRLRVEAAEQVGSLEYRISNFYPYPIAHKWRVARVARGTGDDHQTYSAILDCFEATLALMAALALAFARDHGIPVAAMEEVRRKLKVSGRGTTLGDWTNILKEVSSARAFRQLDPEGTLSILRRALPEGSPAAGAQERLSRRRNNESHQRRVDAIDLPANITAAQDDLELLLEHVAFLADLPVLHIKNAHWDSLSGKGTLMASVLRGDQPIVPTARYDYVTPGIEVGSLYVRDISGALVLLRPYLVRQECPMCRTWSTFHPDRREKGSILLKAVDHAHTVAGDALEDALSAGGYV